MPFAAALVITGIAFVKAAFDCSMSLVSNALTTDFISVLTFDFIEIFRKRRFSFCLLLLIAD
jgi:hypothetical protein